MCASGLPRYVFAYVFLIDNVIREALKQRHVTLSAQETSYLPDSHPAARARRSETIARLHHKANGKCHSAVRQVVSILRKNLGTPFFQYDAALVRDGCFFAGFLLAGESGTREDVEVCLAALSDMRWAFSKKDERQRTVRLVWDARAAQSRGQSSRGFSASPSEDTIRGPGVYEGSYVRRALMRPTSVPPLSLSGTTLGPSFDGSAPPTACTADGRWPSTTSGSGSESEQYQPSSRSPSIPSTSSSYTPSSHSALSLSSVLQGADGVGAPPLLVTSSRVTSGNATNHGGYYVSSYNYLSMTEGVDTRPTAAQSAAVETLPPTEHGSAFSHPTTAFDYTGVSYSGSSVVQQEAGPNYLPPPTNSQGGSPPFGGGATYY